MLKEFALIPDIFDVACYSCPQVFLPCLNPVKDVILNEAIVRDLFDGGWSNYVKSNSGRLDKRANELLKKLATQNRLRIVNSQNAEIPTNDLDWASEAESSHNNEKLDGIIISETNSATYSGKPLFSSIEKLDRTNWWTLGNQSRRLQRNIDEYLDRLRLVLLCANSLMFIDPYLDPSQPNYYKFIDILRQIGSRSVKPQIEIHRVCWYKRGTQKIIEDNASWKTTFNLKYGAMLTSLGLSIDIFIWDDFHDRYLISDLVGINVPHGFDTSQNSQKTTWTKLDREDRDDVLTEFSENSVEHNLNHKFTIPL